MAKKESRKFAIVSLHHLASKVPSIPYRRLYDNINEKYNSLNANEKTQIMSATFNELVPFFEYLGYDIKVKRKSA